MMVVVVVVGNKTRTGLSSLHNTKRLCFYAAFVKKKKKERAAIIKKYFPPCDLDYVKTQ